MKASAVAPALLAVSLLAGQDATLEGVLARAGERVLAFHERFRLVVAEESYVQIQRFYAVSTRAFAGSSSEVAPRTAHR